MALSLEINRLRSGAIKKLVHMVSSAGLVQEPEKIEKQISEWAKEGKELDDLCQELERRELGYFQKSGNRHLWILFCLPFEKK